MSTEARPSVKYAYKQWTVEAELHCRVSSRDVNNDDPADVSERVYDQWAISISRGNSPKLISIFTEVYAGEVPKVSQIANALAGYFSNEMRGLASAGTCD